MELTKYRITDLPAGCLKIHGRTSGKADPLTLFWTASGIEFSTDSSELAVELYCDYSVFEPWIDILVDGFRVQRLSLEKGTNRVTIFRNMERNKSRNIRILRDTQAMGADEDLLVQIKGIEADGSFSVLPEAPLRIEFIGDSLTSGEGLCGAAGEMSWNSLCFDCVEDYAWRTAQLLSADYNSISQSGWGVYCSWNGRQEQSLPRYYEQVCGVVSGDRNKALGCAEPWDFKLFPADVVVVNLGTNDAGSFTHNGEPDPVDGFVSPMRMNPDGTMNEEDLAAVEEACFSFLNMIRRCNPKALIIWCYGMCPGPMEETILSAVRRFTEGTGDRYTDYVRLPSGPSGAREHPGPSVHAAVADILAEHIRSRLKKGN